MAWVWLPAPAGSAVPEVLHAVSVSTSAAPAATRVVLRIEFPSESDLPLGISPDRTNSYHWDGDDRNLVPGCLKRL
ncbi:hypothetical protein Amsp01_009260 [Amycolatopsis sp. NBRC 101858]|nr:hypothetical protein Amsp01_009260 [Amycolatopsis sp. NBRC 101858]